MGRNRTIGGLDREGISKLHPDVEKILLRAAQGLDDEAEHVIVEQLRKGIVRALNRAADHANGINEARHLRNAALLFDGKSIFDRSTRAAHDADLAEAIDTLRQELDQRGVCEVNFKVLAKWNGIQPDEWNGIQPDNTSREYAVVTSYDLTSALNDVLTGIGCPPRRKR